MLQTRTNVAPPRAAVRKVLGVLCRGLPRMRAAAEAWRWRSAPLQPGDRLLQDISLAADQENASRLMPFRLPRQF